MTESKHSTRAGPSRGKVLDPEWEQALRRGQEAEGEAGSLDADLSFVHLLRHTREPEVLSADQLEAIWSDIQAEIAPAGEPWWRKAWVWWSAPALAAAAVLFVVVVDPGSGADKAGSVAQQDIRADERMQAAPPPSASPSGGLAEDEAAQREATPEAAKAKSDADQFDGAAGGGSAAGPTAGTGQLASRGGQLGGFETSFARLAPHGRATISVSVDQSRDELRARLLAKSRGGG